MASSSSKRVRESEKSTPSKKAKASIEFTLADGVHLVKMLKRSTSLAVESPEEFQIAALLVRDGFTGTFKVPSETAKQQFLNFMLDEYQIAATVVVEQKREAAVEEEKLEDAAGENQPAAVVEGADPPVAAVVEEEEGENSENPSPPLSRTPSPPDADQMPSDDIQTTPEEGDYDFDKGKSDDSGSEEVHRKKWDADDFTYDNTDSESD